MMDVSVAAVSGDTLTASAGTETVFTLQVTSAGNFTFTLVDQLDHATGGDENDLVLNLGSVLVATDRDGDSISGNSNGLQITVDDDTPIATQGVVSGTGDEDGVLEGTANAGPGDGIAGGTGAVQVDHDPAGVLQRERLADATVIARRRLRPLAAHLLEPRPPGG